MNKPFLLFIVFILAGCFAPKPAYQSHSDRFKDKFKTSLGLEEEVVYSWYNYVKTKLPNGECLIRTFFPETKQITSKVRYRDDTFNFKEGLATYWNENGQLKSKGSYLNNERDSEWSFYHRKNGELSSIGNFKLGKMEGVWKNYDEKNRLQSEINYINDRKDGKFTEHDTLGVIINTGTYRSDTIYEQSLILPVKDPNQDEVNEEMPYLSICNSLENVEERNKCSSHALFQHIYKNIKYPATAIEYEIEGSTITQFTIDKHGKIKDIEVIVGLCQSIKSECERLISSLPDWEPGTQGGEKINVRYTLPIKFKLQ